MNKITDIQCLHFNLKKQYERAEEYFDFYSCFNALILIFFQLAGLSAAHKKPLARNIQRMKYSFYN
jgi:hypothetical protein